MGYLLYVSHEAENLQFFLWLHDYKRRFNAASNAEQALSPPWDEDTLLQATGNTMSYMGPRVSDRKLAQAVEYKIDFDSKELPLTPMPSSTDDRASFMSGSHQDSDRPKTDVKFSQGCPEVGMNWKPCKQNGMITYISLYRG